MPDPGVRSDVSESLKQKLAAAGPDNTTILSVYYIGRDDTRKPMYRVRYSSTPYPSSLVNQANVKRTAITQTIAWDGKSWAKPKIEKGTPGGAGAKDRASPALKATWLRRISELNMSKNIDNTTATNLTRMVTNWEGSGTALNQRMKFIDANVPKYLWDAMTDDQAQDDLSHDFGGGGGGFGGFSEPVYEAPDRRVVEDMVKGMFVSLVGTIPEDSLVTAATDLYMRDHRRDWDSETQEIDPQMSVLEYVRNTKQYQTIHELRPDSEDERSWISNRRTAAEQGGLTVGAQEDFAIQQATIGGDIDDTRTSAAMQQVQTSGSARGTSIQDRLQATASQMFRSVVR